MTGPKILVVFHTEEGQTAKVAERIAATLRAAGATVDVRGVEQAPSPAGFDGAAVGGSIHLGHHSQELTEYLRKHADALNAMPSALFQVSMTSIDADAEHTAMAHDMVRQLLDETGFAPDAVGLFAGALAYTRYGWLKRRMVRAIAEKGGLDTDTTRDHEYTDWDAVEHFARDVYALSEAKRS